MKKLIYVLLIFVCFFIIKENSDAASVPDTKKDAGFISLNTTSMAEVEPNFATVTFSVENTADNAKKVTEANNLQTSKVINAIKLLASEQTDIIKTKGFSLTPVYSTVQGERKIKNYRAVNSITVETKDITKVADFIDAAVSNGANKTNNLIYSFENDKSYCNGLYPELIKDLKSQAAVIASAAGTSLDGIKHINASCSVNTASGNRIAFAKSNAVSSSDSALETSTPVEAGKVKIRVYVSADFYVK